MGNNRMAEIYFHIETSEIGIGEDKWNCSGISTINIVATGSATAFEVIFEGKINETWCRINGARLDNLSTVNKINEKDVGYQIDLTAFKGFRCNLTSITDGNLTVYGYAVN